MQAQATKIDEKVKDLPVAEKMKDADYQKEVAEFGFTSTVDQIKSIASTKGLTQSQAELVQSEALSGEFWINQDLGSMKDAIVSFRKRFTTNGKATS